MHIPLLNRTLPLLPTLAAVSLFTGAATLMAFNLGTGAPDTPLSDALAVLEAKGRLALGKEAIRNPKDLVRFYRHRKGKPVWLDQGYPRIDAWALLDAVGNASLEGLEPEDYHAHALDSLLRRFQGKLFRKTDVTPRTEAELELLLTDAYLKMAAHLLSGRTHPKSLSDKWHISMEVADLPGYLEQTLARGGEVRESLKRVAPPQPEYGEMKYWLAEYRKILARGGWPAIPPGGALGPGSQGPRVNSLCQRLQIGGEMEKGDCLGDFTPDLKMALKGFQKHHGLDTTGTADAVTLRRLNVPVEERINQIKLNMECWRWLPQDLGERHVRVNIADFRLTAYEGRTEALNMRVVVGRKEDSTPVLSDRIVAVALNPDWNVPPSIATEEILPELREDPEYLARHGMELLAGWSDNARVLRADSIDWQGVDSADFKYRIRQKNGETSALGRVKFVLTNPFNIYLHDTPSKSYFEKHRRALSHGCVRLERPLALASWALGPDSEWDEAALEREISKGEAVSLKVPGKGIPVYILYWTAFVDNQGGLQFRNDVYGWERTLEEALQEKARSF